MLDLSKSPHRRWNPLLREWVLVSPHRMQRPWQGQVEQVVQERPPTYDPQCYLCPGNARAGGHTNPKYTSTFVFDNDYAALMPDSAGGEVIQSPLMVARAERGICRVVCFSPRHDLTIPNMGVNDIVAVIELWCDQYRQLAAVDWINYIQIFENRGEMMGASNPHPHCQLWANQTIPNYPATEQQAQLEFFRNEGKCLLCEYVRIEQETGTRIVCSNEYFTAIVPFWAVWPFEVLVLANQHVTGMDRLDQDAQRALADILKRITSRYDNVFGMSFPYSMGFHQRPTDDQEHPEWHLHAHYFPPLLRSATIRKFMVGYEMLAGPQRDTTPESAAERLRNSAEQSLT
jgi:UDPglucose--hexose-1-phosphate uridylyltransferase